VPPQFGRDVLDLSRRGAAGVVDEHVESAKVSGRFSNGAAAIVRLGKISGDEQAAAADRLDLPPYFFGRSIHMAGGDSEVRATAGQVDRNRGADAQRAARHESRLAIQIHNSPTPLGLRTD
jgi:hypothetical protein